MNTPQQPHLSPPSSSDLALSPTDTTTPFIQPQLLLKSSTTPTATNEHRWLTQQLREPCDISSSTSKTEPDPRLLQLADAYSTILSIVGEDLSRGGILNTPMRAAKAIMELTVGYEHDLTTIVNNAVFDEDCDELVVVRDIEINSLCEHHMLPFRGRVHIGYLPAGKILGLSKFARIADMFAKRFQVQERLTKQICMAIEHVVEPLGVIVVVEAEHSCMSCRGVQKSGSSTITVSQSGLFRDSQRKQEFLQFVNGHSISRF